MSTLHRFAVKRRGFQVKATTMRVVDGDPGVECQIDFAQLGLLLDAKTGRRRRVHALIFTAVVSRHMFVWLIYSQTLRAVIARCDAVWEFFGGVFKVLIPDNLKAVVTGFGRVRRPQDKPRVEPVVQYVRGNVWVGESFVDGQRPSPSDRVVLAAGRDAYPRDHRRPVEMFTGRKSFPAAGSRVLRRSDL